MKPLDRFAAFTRRVVRSAVFQQTVVAAVIVFIVLGINRSTWGFLAPARRLIRQNLSQDYDFRGAWERVRGVQVVEVLGRVRDTVSGLGESSQARAIDSMVPPAQGDVLSGFGWRPGAGGQPEIHEGIDIATEPGSPVVAAQEGTVLAIDPSGSDAGYTIRIDHGGGVTTVYSRVEDVLVKAGDSVTRGEIIGLTGAADKAGLPYLHFELRINEKAIDPEPKLYSEGTS